VNRFDLYNITEISFNSTRFDLFNNIAEMHMNGFFVVSLNPDLNERVQVVCKKLFRDMPAQTLESLDIDGIFAKWEKCKQDARNQKYVW